MKINPKISIVMPMYGVEKYIASAIKSVLNQDFQDWELLIVNDGSPDNSRMIASAFANSDNRIKILDKENGGLSDARNFGLERANGEFVHFFDSDDWIEPDFYSHLLNVADNFDLVVCGYKVDNAISFIERRCISGDLENVKKNNLFSLVSLYLNFAWNKLFRRSYLLKYALFYEKGLYRIEDSEFISRFLAHKPKVLLEDYSGYHYMVRDTATLSNTFDENIFSHLRRSISVHLCIYQNLIKDQTVIMHELGLLSLNSIKSVLYKMLEGVQIFKIKKQKMLINKLLAVDVFIDPSQYPTLKLIDKLVIKGINDQNWKILFFISLLNKIKRMLSL